MAQVFLASNDAFTISNNGVSVFGTSGTGSEVVTLAAGVTGLVADQAVERIVLGGASSAYTYQQQGNNLVVYLGTTIALRVPLQNDDNGTQLTFTNGTVDVKVSSAGMTFGGAAVVAGTTSDAAAVVTPTTIDTTLVSTGTTIVDTTGKAYAFTSSATVPDVLALTSGNDTVTGAAGTWAATDVVIDSSTTDSDVLTVTSNLVAAGFTPTVAKVEIINLNGQFVTAGLDLTNVTSTKTLNINTAIASGTATILAAKTTAVEKIVVGANVTTLDVTADATKGTVGTLLIDAGSAKTINLVAASTAVGSDSMNVTVKGSVALNGTIAVDKMVVTANEAATVTLNGTAASGMTLDVAGSAAVTLKGVITGKTITHSSTGTLTVDLTTAGAADVSKVAADSFNLGADIGALTVKTGAVITTAVTQTALVITSSTATADTNTATLTNTNAAQTSITTSSVKTLNLVSAATLVAGIDATYSTVDAVANNVVLTGTNDVKVSAGTAGTFDASGLVGSLHYTQAATGATTVKGGSCVNAIAFIATTEAVVYTGQNSGDTVTAAALTSGTLSVTSGTGSDSVIANAATTGVISANLGAGNDSVSATGLTTGTISAIMGDGADTVTLGIGVTGTAVVVVDGGAGIDTVKFGPAADISGGTLSLTDVEIIGLSAPGSMTFSAAQMSGKVLSIQGTATAATDSFIVKGIASTTVIDLSGLAMDQSITKAISLATIDASLSAAAVTIKGTNVADTITVGNAGSTVTLGAGADTLTVGTGLDKVVYAAATGGALKTESVGLVGSSATTAPAYVIGVTGDTIGSFAVGTDKIVLSIALGTAGASTGLIASGGESYTAASTSLIANDFLTVALGSLGTAVVANTSGAGRFIFDTVDSLLIYDASGDSAISSAGSYTAGATDDFVVAKFTGVTLTASDFLFA